MAIVDKTTLKTYFETGDMPTESQFVDFIDTVYSLSSDSAVNVTGLFTEETSGQLVGHAANTGTDLIFEMFEGTGTPVSVFQIDGNGDLWNNGLNVFHGSGTSSLFIGTRASLSGYLPTTALNNVIVGVAAGDAITSGDENSIFGSSAGSTMQTSQSNCLFGYKAGITLSGDNNSIFGAEAGADLLGGDDNCYFGQGAGNTNRGSGSIFIGRTAGARQTTTSNKLLISNYFIASEAAELTDSLIVGDFNATVSSQALRFNCGTLTKNGYPILAEDASGDVTVSNEITAADFILA